MLQKFTLVKVSALLAFTFFSLPASAAEPLELAPEVSAMPWWGWPIVLFFFCLVLGVIAPLAGVGGGVLYVPLISGFFPFHLDFVRGAGLLVAMAGALAAAPGLLRRNLANLKLALPTALIASTCSVAGAFLGLSLPVYIMQILLGITILGVSVLLLLSKNVERPQLGKQDTLGAALGIGGTYTEESTGEHVEWWTQRTAVGFIMFVGIGFLAGMFGLGAGWANVPGLNMIMGVPLKVTTATSNFLLSMTDTSAAWVYLNNGCVIPLIAIPSIGGLMLGAKIGALILPRVKPRSIRYIVIAVLFFAGAKALVKGLTM